MLTLSQDQIKQIPKWLKSHKFKPVKPGKPLPHPPEERTWVRDCCQVQIRKEGNDYVAKIKAGYYDWVELGEYLARLNKSNAPNGLFMRP